MFLEAILLFTIFFIIQTGAKSAYSYYELKLVAYYFKHGFLLDQYNLDLSDRPNCLKDKSFFGFPNFAHLILLYINFNKNLPVLTTYFNDKGLLTKLPDNYLNYIDKHTTDFYAAYVAFAIYNSYLNNKVILQQETTNDFYDNCQKVISSTDMPEKTKLELLKLSLSKLIDPIIAINPEQHQEDPDQISDDDNKPMTLERKK